MTYLKDGRYDDAGETMARWADLTDNDVGRVLRVVDLAEEYASTGSPQQPTDLDVEAVFPPYAVPPIYVLLGQYEQALDYLERGFEEGAFGVLSLIADPRVDELRSNPRFVALAEKIGLWH